MHITGNSENTKAANRGNMITKEYYDFLVGEINRGTIKKTVVAICQSEKHDYYTYHLISY